LGVPQHNGNVLAIFASLLQCFAVMRVPSKPLNLKQTMDLHIQVVDLNNFVWNGTLFMSLASLTIHKDKLSLKGHIEL
jgi:hypothetical protein